MFNVHMPTEKSQTYTDEGDWQFGQTNPTTNTSKRLVQMFSKPDKDIIIYNLNFCIK